MPTIVVVLVEETGDRGAGLRPGGEAGAGEQLELQGGVERLGDQEKSIRVVDYPPGQPEGVLSGCDS